MSDAPQAAPVRKLPGAPIVLGIVVIAAGVGIWYFVSAQRARVIEAEGRVTYVDVESRQAEIEMPNPNSGVPMTIQGDVPADCRFTIAGRPAALKDLHVGDKVRVKARITKWKSPEGERHKKIEPLEVDILRTAG